MKIVLSILFILIMFGCGPSMTELLEGARMENREKLTRLSVGMEKLEVLSVMGTKPFVLRAYYDLQEETRRINNPYRVETAQGKDGEVYEIIFYYTDIKKADGVITDDELIPLIIKEGKLIGWGWTFLGDSIERYQIDIRD